MRICGLHTHTRHSSHAKHMTFFRFYFQFYYWKLDVRWLDVEWKIKIKIRLAVLCVKPKRCLLLSHYFCVCAKCETPDTTDCNSNLFLFHSSLSNRVKYSAGTWNLRDSAWYMWIVGWQVAHTRLWLFEFKLKLPVGLHHNNVFIFKSNINKFYSHPARPRLRNPFDSVNADVNCMIISFHRFIGSPKCAVCCCQDCH